MNAGEHIVQVVLGKHDLVDSGEQVRLVLSHPKELWGGEASKRNVGGVRRELVPANHFIQIIHLFGGPAIVPKNRGPKNPVFPVQGHKSVHLPAAADSGNLASVAVFRQFTNTRDGFPQPIFRILF